jgi:hypothetical protein
MVSSTGLLPVLVDTGCKVDFSTQSLAEVKLLHDTWRSPIIYYSIQPNSSRLIQTNFYFRFIVALGTFEDQTFLGVTKVPKNNVIWKSEIMPMLSLPVCITTTGSPVIRRKITVLYPISKSMIRFGVK